MLADGSLCKKELDTVDRLDVHAQIGLGKAEFHSVVQTLCEDLLSAAHSGWSDMCRVDPRTLGELMAEIDAPDLRRKLISLCAAVVEADGHVTEGESIVLVAAVEHWGLQRAMLEMRGEHE
ncbi:MAG: TerB family tellurite resistance protein [Polaromonas sp.]|uniref:TerB family tellurite resistance protein n=1 Tax=Polaromonas sp. TaxID=1869339 RepID=UPI00248706B5|nr:TerB family tellurite resistance protein [Polaromonas sp.]MDI1268404.1 TerB family tellurite resistance protein [Polaromonas sp.]